jgi:diguanylate cyclase (GGDEF)-like protein
MNILIVEENVKFADYLKEYINNHLVFAKCEVVYSYEELKNTTKDYSLYVVSYNLPDSSQKEHIYELLKLKKDVLIMTDSEKNIENSQIMEYALDYIIKEGDYTADYITKFIKRLHKNSNLNILLVDDSLSVRKYQKNILKKLKFKNIFEASNGFEALKTVSEKNIDLIITDLNMPEMDGEELIIKIRQRKEHNYIPIMVISSSLNDKKFIRSLKFGANDYIKKPFLKEEFIVRVNNILDTYDTFQSIKQQLYKDALTGALNRFFLDSRLEELFEMYETKSVAMLDIDFFKKINDTYGHQVGDEVLKCFSESIKNVIRKSDFLIRYGGEEFLIFMPNTTKEEAMVVLLKIKHTLKECKGIKYTFSARIANEGTTLAEMIKIADSRLYKAKKEGRNKIIIR